MGIFAKRIRKEPLFVDRPSKAEQACQQEKTDRARANRKRLNASRKANKGNQFQGGQNKKKGRKAPVRIDMVITVEQITATEYGRLMLDFIGMAEALS